MSIPYGLITTERIPGVDNSAWKMQQNWRGDGIWRLLEWSK